MLEIIVQYGVAILLALLAAGVALWQVRMNVISSSRVRKIDDLREILSTYCSELENCSKLKLDYEDERNADRDSEETRIKYYDPYTKSANEVLKLQSKSLLYLDSNDSKQLTIEKLIMRNSNLVHEMGVDNRETIHRNIEEIIHLAKKVFADEWVKVYKLW